MKSIGTYLNDIKRGAWRNFNTKGDLVDELTYYNDSLTQSKKY